MPDIYLKIGLEGEKAFKKSLSDINSSFRVLGSEMKLVSSQFDKTDKSEEAIAARSKVLNKEIDAQKEKIGTLEAALKNASESFGDADKRTQNWQIQLNNAKVELNKLESELKDNEKALDDVTNEFDDAEKEADDLGDEVKQTGKQAESAESKFKKVGKALATVGKAVATATAAIGTAAVAAGKKLVDLSQETAAYGDTIDKSSQKLGLSAEAYQEWDYVLSQNGMNIDSVAGGIKKLTDQIDSAKSGSASAIENFSKLGISMDDLNTMSREEIFSAAIEGMQGMADSTDRAALANELFGRLGQSLAPLFNSTAEGTQQLKDAAHDLGFVMSDEAVKASAAYTDSLDTLQRTFTGVKNNIVSELLPGMTSIMDGLADLLVGNDNAKEKIQKGADEIVTKLSEIFPQVGDMLLTLIDTGADTAPQLITSLVDGITENLPSIIESVGEIVMTFLTALVSALPQFTQGAVDVVVTLVDAILDNLPMIIDAACQVIVSLATGLSDSLPMLIPSIVAAIMEICTTITNNLPLILNSALELVLALAEGIINSIPEITSRLPELIGSIVDFIVQSLPQIIAAGVQLFTVLVTNLPAIIQGIISAIPQILSAIFNAFSGGDSMMQGIGQNLVRGLWNGIVSLADWLWQSVSAWISGIWNGIKDFFGIYSPSKQMGWIGEMLVKGMADSIDYNADEAVKAAESMSSDVLDAFDNLNADVGLNVAESVPSSAGSVSAPLNISLNISTFNNYSAEDIRQLTNEIMQTADGFMKRRNLAFG